VKLLEKLKKTELGKRKYKSKKLGKKLKRKFEKIDAKKSEKMKK